MTKTDAKPKTASGIALDELDPKIRPQDDLYRYVNGAWIERTTIPEDKSRYGSFTLLAEAAETAVREIIVEAQTADLGTVERTIGDLYTSFMNQERIESLRFAPIQENLNRVDDIHEISNFLKTLGSLEREGVSGFLAAFVDNDPGNPERYLVFLEQAGLGLPDESYYREETFAEIREKYLAYLEKLFTLAGFTEPDQRAKRVMRLENALAGHHWDNVRTRDSQATYNPMPWADFAALLANVPLELWRDALGAPVGSLDTVSIREPSFAQGLATLLVPGQLDAWRDWLRVQIVRDAAPYLHEEVVQTHFDFYGRTLSGTPKIRQRWKRGVSLVEGALGEAIGRIYVQRHFSKAAKAAMDELVENLVEAYRESISKLDWMSEQTRASALAKMEKFTPKIGYPKRWRDYSALTTDPEDLVGNVRATHIFDFERELNKIGKPIDREEWFMTPQTVNAYYNPGFNEIVFPAAILQYPFFVQERDAAANYGAIGAVIGHEIGHGFDDQGSRFDGDGRLFDWWSAKDREAFEERTGRLIAQYDALEPAQLPGHRVNGALTIGENIGDLGGLGIAWRAYLLSLGGKEPPIVDGLSAAERFFFSWAQSWQSVSRDEEAMRLLTIDPHAPAEFRCNQIVRNLDLFAETFNLTPGDALWLPPAERVTIW